MRKTILINSEPGLEKAAEVALKVIGKEADYVELLASELDYEPGLDIVGRFYADYLVVSDGNSENLDRVAIDFKSSASWSKQSLIILTRDLDCKLEGADVVKIQNPCKKT